MTTIWSRRGLRVPALFFLFFLLMAGTASAASLPTDMTTDPSLYLSFNEGSGINVLDSSGHGNGGALHSASRIENGGCGGALMFNGINSYVAIPHSSRNHPEQAITVSSWFYTDSFRPQTLISSYNEGGYLLGIGDGGDLWWTINLEGYGDLDLPVQHESITLNQWHHVTGTYDGQTTKIYLDGVLRNQQNASGLIHYSYPNYVILGANAGTGDQPDPGCSDSLHGGLDEVRIYPRALPYGQVMDDRFRCSQEPVAPPSMGKTEVPAAICYPASGNVHLGPGESATRILSVSNKTDNGIWMVTLPAGSKLVVSALDSNSKADPDTWYIEIGDEHGRITRTIAFPNTNNAPAEGVVPSGNATVTIHYFDGKERFPTRVAVRFESIAPPAQPPSFIPHNVFVNPIIIIYSASWATLIALILVVVWLHRRKNERKKEKDTQNDEKGKDEEKIIE
ncbi:MAG: LamG domain-containing protein [Methanoregula sp.]|nr:LamG domain-containing protein [Methanoregula sp.]